MLAQGHLRVTSLILNMNYATFLGLISLIGENGGGGDTHLGLLPDVK